MAPTARQDQRALVEEPTERTGSSFGSYLGILRMRSSGRPDGLRPARIQSLLEYHEHRLDERTQSHGSAAEFVLDEACRELRRGAAVLPPLRLPDGAGGLRGCRARHVAEICVLDLCA